MISRLVRIQLVVFAVVTVVAISWTLLSYVRLPQLLGFGQYRVTLNLTHAAGLYPNALVTYRGVDIGRVDRIEVTPDGIAAVLLLDNGTDVPANSIAHVGSRSAIGEQYADLVPRSPAGPMLADGYSIAAADTRMPVSTGDLLRNLDALLSSVPKGPLRTVLNELYQGFHGRGDDLGRLISSSDSLVQAANTELGPTTWLLRELRPVLDTQRRLGPTTHQLLADMAKLTDTVRSHDDTLRSILDRSPGFADESRSLVDGLAPILPGLLDHTGAVGDVTKLYVPSIEQIMVIYPAFTAGLQTALLTGPGDTVQLSARTNINEPPPCTEGYPGTQRDPRQTAAPPAEGNLYCRAPQRSPLAVRGARNIPCPNDPARRSATPEGCGLGFQTRIGEGAPADPNGRKENRAPTSGMRTDSPLWLPLLGTPPATPVRPR